MAGFWNGVEPGVGGTHPAAQACASHRCELLFVRAAVRTGRNIKTTVRLVSVPTGVTDNRASPIRGLAESDFLVTDNDRLRDIHVASSQESTAPTSLVVAIQSSDITAQCGNG